MIWKKSIIWPSWNNENPLTWKCKLFGCRDEFLPFTFCESSEKHGVSGLGSVTATTMLITSSFRGCIWCKNYKKIIDKEEEVWPKWSWCGCEICEASKR